MAKAFLVIQNGNRVLTRHESKSEAEAEALRLANLYPAASFEFGKMDKRLFHSRTESVFVPDEEVY